MVRVPGPCLAWNALNVTVSGFVPKHLDINHPHKDITSNFAIFNPHTRGKGNSYSCHETDTAFPKIPRHNKCSL